MSLPVFHLPELAGAVVGGSVELTGDEARHAVVVRRIRVGEQVALTDGEGTTVVGTVAATTKASLTADVSQVVEVPRESPRLVVVQAIPKGDRGELAVEMLTEVGVDVIALLAMAGSLLLGEYLAGAVIALMLSGGGMLELYAAGRARKELSGLLERAPRALDGVSLVALSKLPATGLAARHELIAAGTALSFADVRALLARPVRQDAAKSRGMGAGAMPSVPPIHSASDASTSDVPPAGAPPA